MQTDDKNLIELYQDYIDDEGYVQRYNYDKGRYYNTGICLKGTKGNPGNPGRPGKDGLTPRINQDNGHWMIGDVDTGVTASLASESAVSGGNTISAVTTGEKYTWNNKANIWRGTQAEYDLINTPDDNTIYIITS